MLNRLWLSAFYAAIAFSLVGLALFQALRSDMHHNLTFGPSPEAESMSVAISDMVYGLDRGYVMHMPIYRHFVDRLWTSANGSIELASARLKDAAYVNQAIADATKLDIAPNSAAWGDFKPLYAQAWRPIFAEDIGRVDYVKLAFKTFGFNVESLHYLYFAILLVSTGLFCLGFHRNKMAMVTLIVYLLALNLMLQSNIFPISAPSISAYRALSTLAVIPVLHLANATWFGVRITSISGAAVILQAAVLTFAIWTRSSGQWSIIALVLCAASTWIVVRRRTVFLPLALAIVGFIGLKGYQHYAAHPAYFGEDLLPGHFVWHSAYLGLTVNPKWPGRAAIDDTLAFKAAESYMKQTQPSFPFTRSPITKGYWFRVHDRAVRAVYLDFARTNPGYMAELFLWRKPKRYIAIYGAFLSGIGWAGLAGGILGTATMACALRSFRTREIAGAMLLPAGAIAVSSLVPSIWAYPALYVMHDSVWAVTGFLCSVAILALSRVPFAARSL